MRRTIILPLTVSVLFASGHASADTLQVPPVVQAMLDAAIAAGEEAAVNAIVKYAKVVDKPAAEVVERAASVWKTERREATERRLREAPFLDLVKGRAELGGYVTSGNIETLGLTGLLDLKREGLDWRHKLRVQGD